MIEIKALRLTVAIAGTLVVAIGVWLANPAPRAEAGDTAPPIAAKTAAQPTLQLRTGLVLPEPAGWHGAVTPDGASASLVGPDGDSTIIATLKQGSREQIEAELGSSIDLGRGIVLTPLAQPVNDGDLYTNDFAVSGTPKPARGIVSIKALPDGRAVALIAVATVDAIEDIRRTQREMMVGLHVEAAAPTAVAKSDSGWSRYLRGRYVVRFYAGNGYSEKHEMWFCSDGRFASAMDGGGFTAGVASGAFGSNHGGTWSASGDTASAGILIIDRSDGQQAQIRVEIGSDGLYLNGERWLRGDNNACE